MVEVYVDPRLGSTFASTVQFLVGLFVALYDVFIVLMGFTFFTLALYVTSEEVDPDPCPDPNPDPDPDPDPSLDPARTLT